MKYSKKYTTVTPFSKYLAMSLFIVLPYEIICNGQKNNSQCSTDIEKYNCSRVNSTDSVQSCILKDQYVPSSISCGGNIGHTQRETQLCNSGDYICGPNGLSGDAAHPVLINKVTLYKFSASS